MANIRLRGAEESFAAVGGNSVAFANGDLVALSGGYAIKAIATSKIIGIANGAETFASDNQTVAKSKLSYLRVEPGETQIELGTSAATLAATDVGKYYNINASQVVDLTTGSTSPADVNTSDAGAAADPVLFKQLRLERFISTSKGVFTIL